MLAVSLAAGVAGAQDLPEIRVASVGQPTTFATHGLLWNYGFSFGPSDGQFGAMAIGGGRYRFYGAAGSRPNCPGGAARGSTFAFEGTLDRVTVGDGCRSLFGPAAGPRGWLFDKDYAGGGQVVRFALGDKRGWLMPFHGEAWWNNPAAADGKCEVAAGAGSKVDCFYSGLGLAVSLDDGRSFKVVGQIMQPSQPIQAFIGRGRNMHVGYGSLVVADANGRHLDNPPANPGMAYFYLFYLDLLPGFPGVCGNAICMGVARARYADLVAAALSGDPHRVATQFRKYDGVPPDPWAQPATGDTPDQSAPSGRGRPLWTDEPGGVGVLYDSAFDLYLAVSQMRDSVKLRASKDLLHWSGPIGPPIEEPGRTLYYPTLIGETGDPTVAGTAPRVYFSSFPVGKFPDYRTSVFESVEVRLERGRP